MKVALPQIRCQLHDHAKQYDNDDACHNKTEWWKVAWKYISEWLWKCHNMVAALRKVYGGFMVLAKVARY